MKIHRKLLAVQRDLKAPKSQYNSFGKYSYRNCEDILEAVKPFLEREKLSLVLLDDLLLIGARYYVKASAVLSDSESEESITVTAFAREEEAKKGMDGSQVTGASSSYARKYALNGLFCIDDIKDSDTTNKGEKIYTCEDCGKEFSSFTAKSTGKTYTAGQAYHMSEKKYGRALCKECAQKQEGKSC